MASLPTLMAAGCALDVPYPGMYPGMIGGVYPPPEGMLSIPLGPGYGEMYTHKTLKHNYKGGYALHHTQVHISFCIPHAPCSAGYEGMWFGEHPRDVHNGIVVVWV